MLQGRIQVTSFDMGRLFAMIEHRRNQGSGETVNLQTLEEELARCEEVSSDEVAADVVTMNSRVLLSDVLNGHDKNCRAWIRKFREPAPAGAEGEGEGRRERRRRRG